MLGLQEAPGVELDALDYREKPAKSKSSRVKLKVESCRLSGLLTFYTRSTSSVMNGLTGIKLSNSAKALELSWLRFAVLMSVRNFTQYLAGTTYGLLVREEVEAKPISTGQTINVLETQNG
jgi:hypothetical protein